MDDFIVRALIAACATAIVTSVLGCFVIWRRMAYFGDALAHSALLGIAFGFWLGLAPILAVIAVCGCFAVLLVWLQQKQPLTIDTILGILSHSALAFGVIALSLSNVGNIDLHSFLFGDILTVSTEDLTWLLIAGAFIVAVILYYWQPLLLLTINSELAAAEGVSTLKLHSILIFLMTLAVAISIQIIGVLLIASLLIIPVAGARLLAKSPEGMALLAGGIGVSAAGMGLWLSFLFDIPSGPAIVGATSLLFVLCIVLTRLQRQ